MNAHHFVKFRIGCRENETFLLRFEVFTTVKMSMLVFWIVTPCGLVGRYQRFGGIYCPSSGRYNPEHQHKKYSYCSKSHMPLLKIIILNCDRISIAFRKTDSDSSLAVREGVQTVHYMLCNLVTHLCTKYQQVRATST
jgi:hypothetical protein